MKTLSPLRSLTLLFALACTLVLGFTTAQALPPGGAATVNTPGTNSTVSPSTLKAGDTLKFKLTGFPANEQVYVKVDNGSACPSDAAQGACVVHQQKSDSNGTVEGSFVLSKDLADGEHTLRFLATEIKRDSNGNQKGTLGYSNESPAFTISGVNENSSGGTTTNVDPNVINGGAKSGDSGNSGNSSNNSSGNQGGSGDSGSSNGSNGSNGSSNNSGSNGGSSNSGSSDSSDSEETVYLDADGNEISKEEYDALMADSNETAKPSTSASAKAKSSASASSSASAKSTDKAENTEETSSESDSGSDFPWFGVIVFALAVVAAAGVLISRRKKS